MQRVSSTPPVTAQSGHLIIQRASPQLTATYTIPTPGHTAANVTCLA